MGTGSRVLLLAVAAVACERDRPPAEEVERATAEVHVTLTEWAVELSPARVPAGEVTFRIRNEGEYEHVFEVERGEEEWETGRIPPDGETVLTARLSGGDYEAYCPLTDTHGDHRGQGMATRLVVD